MISPTAAHPYPPANDLQPVSDASIESIVQLCKLLSDETRVRILTLLAENEELCVRSLWERLAQTQPGVSHHLALLREGGLVDCHQVGRNIFYRLNRAQFARALRTIWRTPLGAQFPLPHAH